MATTPADSQFLTIESASNEGAFGVNRLPEPTDAQKKPGNYKMGRFTLYGLPIVIEQPRNSYRTGVSDAGKRWVSRMAAHYGYVGGTKGADGDAVDVFVGYYPQSEMVYVINQYWDGRFDEHKVMLAFPDEEAARNAYLGSYDKGWKGLKSLIPCSISQFKWWLKNSDLSRPLSADQLPFEGLEDMNRKLQWDDNAAPLGVTLDRVLYDVRRNDAGGLLLDSVTVAEIMDDADSVMTLDALVVPFQRLERQMNIIRSVMERAGQTVKPSALQITEPFKQRGTANVAAVFELSDGQTVSVFFHNPDVTPTRIAPTDELVSWKWMLNKKDITIVVAPERGNDLNVREVARRIMKLAEKNSAAFARANARRADRMQSIEGLKTEIAQLETELTQAQRELEVAKIAAESRPVRSARVVWEESVLEAIESGWSMSRSDAQGAIEVNPDAVDAEWVKQSSPQDAARAVMGADPEPAAAPAIDWSKASEIDTQEKLQALGVARIDEVGAENVYVEKDGVPYFFKPGNASRYAVGEHDFSNDQTFAPIEEPHYSVQILGMLVTAHGWTRENELSVQKDVGGATAGGELNPGGSRIVFGVFNSGNQRYLSLESGMETVFDMDCRDKDAAEAAKEFNAKTEAWAKESAAAPGTLKLDQPETPVKTDLSYRAVDGMFTMFYANTKAGEDAWRELAEQTDGTAKVLTQHAEETANRMRAAGYTVSEDTTSVADIDPDALLAELAEAAGEKTEETPADTPENEHQALIDAYIKAWGKEAERINALVASVDIEAIADSEQAKAEERRLGDAVNPRGEDGYIFRARDALEAAGIKSWDSRLSILHDTPEYAANSAANQAYRELVDRLRAIAKEKLQEAGAAELAALPDDAPLAGAAIAIYRKHGIEVGGRSEWIMRLVNAIDGKDADYLRRILASVGSDRNKASAEVFARSTGIKLGKTQKERARQIDEWAGISPEQRAEIQANKDAERKASRDLENVKDGWAFLNSVKVQTDSGIVTGQKFVIDAFAEGYQEIGTSKRGAATTYGMKNGNALRTVTRAKAFNAFFRDAAIFGGLRQALEAVGADISAPVDEDAEKAASVDAAYQFENASKEFKAWLSASVDESDYSPFQSARVMDEAAKRHGASVEWGFFGGTVLDDVGHAVAQLQVALDVVENNAPINAAEGNAEQAALEEDVAASIREAMDILAEFAVDEGEIGQTFASDGEPLEEIVEHTPDAALDSAGEQSYVGKIRKGGNVIGRIDMGGDGKAMVFVGEDGGDRVKTPSGITAMYSDDDAPSMIDWLIAMIETPADPNIGREWDSTYGRQRIAQRIQHPTGDMYEVETLGGDGSGEVRRYRVDDIEDTIKTDEYRLTPEYAAEQAEAEETRRLRAERDARAAEQADKVNAEIAEFTSGMTPANAERTRLALVAQVKSAGAVITRKSLVDSRVADGYKVVSHDGRRRLEAEDGRYLEERQTTKTGMDYAAFLIARAEAQAEPQAEASGEGQAKTFLQAVIEGKTDALDGDVPAKLEAIRNENAGNQEMEALWADATRAYIAQMTKAASAALSGA
ncbi:hypothetical protein [Pusillimonas noertemannii]|uniref:Defence against restriction A N-terminal domain-containing protein n=1 Tax=Pusillimonas noertemannii TaxID=305977 RepID=A0A2U1CMC5_9BURK|nr:hypothetical protein [Pusillimonas noertemannii]NYT68806.1 hypothetical protein [Pusillimonas noertemannii]PVY62170.1 hypothetical protein C7440_1663 [Pusillimonas noertemannii]TFL10842.1 hypothetical protein CSC72_10040 [Pusillimonas noertemannii]